MASRAVASRAGARRAAVAFTVAVSATLVLAGCGGAGAPSATDDGSSIAPTAATTVPATAPATTGGATASASPTPTAVDWAVTSVNAQADCDVLSSAGPLSGLRYAKTPMDDFGPMLITANVAGLLEGSAGSCWIGDEHTGFEGFFVGSTSDGGVIAADAFDAAVFTPPGGGYVDVPYETERYSAGYVYFADSACSGPTGRCAVCHYVEDDVMVSHSRPGDGACRDTLYALVDAIRG